MVTINPVYKAGDKNRILALGNDVEPRDLNNIQTKNFYDFTFGNTSFLLFDQKTSITFNKKKFMNFGKPSVMILDQKTSITFK